jgi:hypothetical protein
LAVPDPGNLNRNIGFDDKLAVRYVQKAATACGINPLSDHMNPPHGAVRDEASDIGPLAAVKFAHHALCQRSINLVSQGGK